MVYGEKTGFIHNWLVPFYLALSLFFAPTCRLLIKDPVKHQHFVVDHVPWGLGMVAGTISQMGDTITKEVEKVFSLPDDLKYHKTGSMMASNLIAESSTFQITNVELLETLKSFTNQCLVYDALLGRKYTLDDLKNAPDLWALASQNPSPARCFVFKAPGKGQKPEILTCQEGVKRLTPLLKHNVENAFQLFSRKLFGGSEQTSNLGHSTLKTYLPGAFNYMTKLAQSAEDIMLQQMLIRSTMDAIETKSTALGNAPNVAVRRAYLQQRAPQETLAGIAAQKLIAMKNVMEALIYVAFIFLLHMKCVKAL
jgi:conjugal transfer mating pair stabilization protein TraG